MSYQELQAHIAQQPLIASHSHRTPYAELKGKMDLFSLFNLHSGSSLVSAGMSERDWKALDDPTLDAEAKWTLFEPYWKRLRHTAYGHSFLLATEAIFGVKRIDENTWRDLNAKVREAYSRNDSSYYDLVVKKLANVEKTVWDYGTLDAPEGYYPAYRFENRRIPSYDAFITVRTREDLEAIEDHYGERVYSFADYLALFERVFVQKVNEGMIAVKFLLAYLRTLDFQNVTFDEAEKVFNTIFTRMLPNPGFQMNQLDGPSWEDNKRLQDFMVHRVLRMAAIYKLPVQIHAGFQLGKRTVTNFGDPKLLNDLFIRYRSLQFVIMHTAIPFSYDLAALAKNFPNVAVDFSWANTLSPTMTKRFFAEMIEFLPSHKLLAFGDDNGTVEGTLGEAIMAREMVLEALWDKVESGYMTLEDAKEYATTVLYDNAKRIFAL